jgi:mannose-1-phosphate guanylyltransferase/mannose-1-phosphate guanylyltransferase/phosphomannomutase
MQAILIAGGKGTRLRPLTYRCPKPLLPLIDRPFLAWLVDRCRQAGIVDILVNVGYLGQQIAEAFGDGAALGVTLRYLWETGPLDTAGAILLAKPLLSGEPLVVFNADILTDLDLRQLMAFHRQHGGQGTLTLTRVADITPFGLVECDATGRVQAFREKPDPEQAAQYLAAGINTINAGTYVLDPAVFEPYPVGQPLSFERVVFPEMLTRGLAVHGFVWGGHWLDMGTPAKYLQAQWDVLQKAVPFPMVAQEISPGVWVSPTAVCHAEARLTAPCFVGDRVEVGPQGAIPAHTVVGADSHINRAIAPGLYPPGSLLL